MMRRAVEVRTKVKSGAATADGATHGMAGGYRYFRDIHATDPDTATAWTSGGVNGVQIGPEVVTRDGRAPRHLDRRRGPRNLGQLGAGQRGCA
jgi:hypothetical protein